MTNLVTFSDLANQPVEGFKPKPTRLTDEQVEASNPLWTSADTGIKIGLWECTPGRFTADRSETAEYCHIISGSATVKNLSDGTSRDIRGGDLLVLPKGWLGEWVIHEHMRKLYFLSNSWVLQIPGKCILAPVRGQTQKGIALCYAMKTQKRIHPSRNA